MSSTFRLTTIEEFEAATERLLETGAKVGADSWQARVKNQTPHCKFGEEGICCRICSMGPCRITKKRPEVSADVTLTELQEEISFALQPVELLPILTMEGKSATPFIRYPRMEIIR